MSLRVEKKFEGMVARKSFGVSVRLWKLFRTSLERMGSVFERVKKPAERAKRTARE